MRFQAIFAAAATAATFGALPSQAATVSTTDSFTGSALIYDPATDYSPGTGYSPPSQLGGYDGLLTLKGFNTALGTLNSVSIDETIQSSVEFQQAYAFGSSIVINASVFAEGQSPYGGFGFNLPYTFSIPSTVPGNTYDTGTQYSNATSATYSNNFPLTFSPFLGGNIYVPVLGYVIFGSSTGSFLGNATSTYTYSMAFTYDYTPAVSAGVPEPGTWTTMLIGLGALGLLLRSRRRKLFAVA